MDIELTEKEEVRQQTNSEFLLTLKNYEFENASEAPIFLKDVPVNTYSKAKDSTEMTIDDFQKYSDIAYKNPVKDEDQPSYSYDFMKNEISSLRARVKKLEKLNQQLKMILK